MQSDMIVPNCTISHYQVPWFKKTIWKKTLLSRRDHKNIEIYVFKRTTCEKLFYFLSFNNKSNINDRHETNQCDWKVVLN